MTLVSQFCIESHTAAVWVQPLWVRLVSVGTAMLGQTSTLFVHRQQAMVIHSGREHLTAEESRLREDLERKKYWKRWGPYLSERQWVCLLY
jgi:hypothetical protein